MQVFRGLAGALLWIVASLLGLVGVLLCVTLILLPVGIPVLGLARRLWTRSVRLMLPRSVAHPVKETKRRGRARGSEVADDVGSTPKRLRRKAKDAGEASRKVRTEAGKKGRKLTERRRRSWFR